MHEACTLQKNPETYASTNRFSLLSGNLSHHCTTSDDFGKIGVTLAGVSYLPASLERHSTEAVLVLLFLLILVPPIRLLVSAYLR